ncbi:Mor transcription activator family protein [Pseudoalteromonas sp. 1181_04]|uniref:Mor transcription activator family protein n=1 Tax=Pseudoalteromonas sp. 1181_04 TaxID=2604450 RepID=UPI004063EF02
MQNSQRIDIKQSATNLGELPEQHRAACMSKWPANLLAFHCVIDEALKGFNLNEQASVVNAVLLSLSHYMGGRDYYLPQPTRLTIPLRNIAIWKNFDGSNTNALALEHGLSTRRVQEIISNQRELHRMLRKQGVEIS